MTEMEIREGFKLFGLEDVKEYPFRGPEQYAKKIEIVSVLRDIRTSIGTSVLNCNQTNK